MKYKINKGFIVQKLDDKTVIFDGEESAIYTFNETASYILKKLKMGLEEDKIIEAMVKRYGLKADKLKADFKELVEELKKKKIISSGRPKKQKRQPAD